MAKIFDDFALSPAAIIAVSLSQKRTVAAVVAFVEADVRISGYFGTRVRGDPYKRIVGRVQDECGHGNLIDDPGGGGALVVIGGTCKSAVRSGNSIVELAKRFDALGAGKVEMAGEEAGLFPHTLPQLPKEIVFVQPIRCFVQGVGGGSQVDGGTNGGNSAQLGRRLLAPFAGQFQDQVPAHGKTHQSQAADVVPFEQFMRYPSHVLRASGMIQGGCQVVGAPAVALVHADYIHAGVQTFGGQSHRVSGVAGTFQTMNNQQSESGRSIILPMTMTKNGNAGLDFNQALFGGRQLKPALQEEICQRLPVSAAQKAASAEWFPGLRRPHLIILNRYRPGWGDRGRDYADF